MPSPPRVIASPPTASARRLREGVSAAMVRAVQSPPPFGRLTPRRAVAVNLHQLAPYIRIAHRIKCPITIPRRVIFDHELVLFLAGQGRFVLNSTVYPIAPHSLFLIPPFTPHTIETAPGITCEHIAIHFDLTRDLPHADQPSRRKPYAMRLPRGLRFAHHLLLQAHDRLEDAFVQLLRARSAIDPLAELDASAHLLSILVQLLRLGSRPRDQAEDRRAGRLNEARIARAIDFASTHLANPLGAEDLAGVAGLSLSHFTRLFRAWTGYAPMEYLRRLRIEHARRLLGDVDLSVKQIAHRTGFDDAYHFSKVFRRLQGMQPTAYRESLLAPGSAPR